MNDDCIWKLDNKVLLFSSFVKQELSGISYVMGARYSRGTERKVLRVRVGKNMFGLYVYIQVDNLVWVVGFVPPFEGRVFRGCFGY